MNGVRRSCRCIRPVARRSRGRARRGRSDAWPTRSGDNGKNRFQADRQLLRYRLSRYPRSLQSLFPDSPAVPSSPPGLRHRPSFCVSFSPLPLSSPPGRDYVRSSRFPPPVSLSPLLFARRLAERWQNHVGGSGFPAVQPDLLLSSFPPRWFW